MGPMRKDFYDTTRSADHGGTQRSSMRHRPKQPGQERSPRAMPSALAPTGRLPATCSRGRCKSYPTRPRADLSQAARH